MTEHGIDPTRQGVASHEPEPITPAAAPQMTAAEAVALVSSWDADMPRSGLHRICEALACCNARRRVMGA